jgi:hypothetical protein
MKERNAMPRPRAVAKSVGDLNVNTELWIILICMDIFIQDICTIMYNNICMYMEIYTHNQY